MESQGRILHTLQSHTDRVNHLAFSPDGKMIASAIEEIKLWNLKGELLYTLQGHNDKVNYLAFSPDGKIIASASRDRTIKLWNRQGELLHSLQSHTGSVYHVAFSPDGKSIISAGEDNTIKLWSLDLNYVMTRGCNWVKNYLTNNSHISQENRKICDGYL